MNQQTKETIKEKQEKKIGFFSYLFFFFITQQKQPTPFSPWVFPLYFCFYIFIYLIFLIFKVVSGRDLRSSSMKISVPFIYDSTQML